MLSMQKVTAVHGKIVSSAAVEPTTGAGISPHKNAGWQPALRFYFVFVDYAFFHYEAHVIESGDVF